MNFKNEKILWQCLAKYVISENFRNTKSGFEIRVEFLKSIAKYMNLDITSVQFAKTSFISPNNFIIIDNAWRKILKQNFQISQDDLNVYYRVKYDPLVSDNDLVRFITFLRNHDFIVRENSEKVLKSNTLLILLAVDGFQGYSYKDLVNYIPNLRKEECFCDKPELCECNSLLELHTETVRGMYHLDNVKTLSGTDATAIVFLALLKTYEKYACTKNLKMHLNDVENYLLKNSIQNTNIKKAKNEIDEIGRFYRSNVNSVSKIASTKINQLNLLK